MRFCESLLAPILTPTMPGLPGPRLQPLKHRLMPLGVESEPVDHRPVFNKPENARLRIARLRQRRDCADFRKAEAKPQQGVRNFGVLVIPGGHADGRCEMSARQAQRRGAGLALAEAGGSTRFSAPEWKAHARARRPARTARGGATMKKSRSRVHIRQLMPPVACQAASA